MSKAELLCEIWRGDFMESRHLGHAVVCGRDGEIIEAWGDPGKVVLPRSSAKMIQGLGLVESGAADAMGLTSAHLALACASHDGAAIHTDPVSRWLAELGLVEDDLRCGPQMPADRPARKALICSDTTPCQVHNNCSGKHAGFLTLSKHLGAGPEYIDPDHPVQKGVRDAFEDVTGAASPGFGIDGCSAPNFATTMHGMARAMAFFATAREGGSARESAAARLRDAMALHPDLVAGEGRACTELMRAMGGAAAIKTGAEAYFVAMLPAQGLGIAVKIDDGGTRAAECVIAALLVRHGVLDAAHPATLKRMDAVVKNRRGVDTGVIRPAPTLRR
ncbi:asparaginase [Aliiroseovarius sp.]|uniref:asparaginase n=1 Tax=Aliiroseovarius sp. TaxID=1872442 RepID=UPI00260B238D|nr:asparaginase [Aliiroseovarius sp.]